MGAWPTTSHSASLSSGRPGQPGRRALLLAAAGLSVTGLAGSAAQHPPAAPVPAAPAGAASGHSPRVPAGPPAPRLVASGPAVPALRMPRARVVAEFSGRKPKEWGTAVTGVVVRTGSRHAVLTFDACGGPWGSAFDRPLLATLRRLQVPATLFLNARWIRANRGITADLAADPLFELANHGSRHVPLSVSGRSAYGIPGTSDLGQVYDEVMGNQSLMERLTGKAPRFFRPGTAHYDDVAAAIVRAVGLIPVNFTLNGDAGATFPAAEVAAEVGRIRGGDIAISHFNQPAGGTAEGYARVLPMLLDRGVTFARLGETLPL